MVTTSSNLVVSEAEPAYSRLIEHYFPSIVVSDEGVAERYQRGRTPHTIFTWWARRPFTAMRGVVAAALSSATGSQADQKILESYCVSDGRSLPLEGAKRLCAGENQRVLDIFAGGATIPLEAAALGASAYSVDNNELANFIQVALLQLSQVSDDLPQLLQVHGRRVLSRLYQETEPLFPSREAEQGLRTVAYIWSRSAVCPECKGSLSLLKRPWVSKKNGKSLFIKREAEVGLRLFSTALSTSGTPAESSGAWQQSSIVCPFCHYKVPRAIVDSVVGEHGFDEMIACGAKAGNGKTFRVATGADLPSLNLIESHIAADIEAIGHGLPMTALPRWSGITNPSLYGVGRFVDIFNARQRAVLTKLCRILNEEHAECESKYGAETAKAITAYLSGFIDQLVDWNCRLCMWIAQNEQVGRALSGPGIPMMWDFAEIDPVEHGPANLWDKLERIAAGAATIPKFAHRPAVLLADSRKLTFPDEYFDVIATDPPYFDNIFYNVLADCIYVWKRFALVNIFPDRFQAEMTNATRELSASKYRHGSTVEAAKYYTEGMTQVLSEVSRLLKPDGVLAFVFAHRTIDGWTSVVDSFSRAKLDMDAAWELQIERKHRPRGMNSDAVNTSFVLVGKKRITEWKKTHWDDLSKELDALLAVQHDRFLLGNCLPEDIGRSLFGIAVSRCVQFECVLENGVQIETFDILRRLAQHVQRLVPQFQIDER